MCGAPKPSHVCKFCTCGLDVQFALFVHICNMPCYYRTVFLEQVCHLGLRKPRQDTSHYRIRTELPPFAGFAVFADPYIVELVHRLFHDFGLIGEDARFEVALAVGFHADARTRKIRTSDINLMTVEDQHFEVNTGAKHPLQSVEKHRVIIEVFSESRTWFFRMNKANLYATLYQLCNEREKRFLLFAHLHVEILDIGSADPEGVFRGGHAREDSGVVGGVGDVSEHIFEIILGCKNREIIITFAALLSSDDVQRTSHHFV